MRKLFLIIIVFVCSFGSFGQAKKQVTFEAEIATLAFYQTYIL
jgi:hypothetical protein